MALPQRSLHRTHPIATLTSLTPICFLGWGRCVSNLRIQNVRPGFLHHKSSGVISTASGQMQLAVLKTDANTSRAFGNASGAPPLIDGCRSACARNFRITLKNSPPDSTHWSRRFFKCSKQPPLNSSTVMPFSDSAVFVFHSRSANRFPFKPFFVLGNKTKKVTQGKVGQIERLEYGRHAVFGKENNKPC